METRQQAEAKCRYYHPTESPIFLPGDKVFDKRDIQKTIWRIIGRIGYLDTELLTLRKVGDATMTVTGRADTIIPHLEMVAKYAENPKLNQ